MQRRLVIGTALLAAGSTLLFAADFWDKKAPEEWTSQEVEMLLSDSPWAKPVDIRFVGDTSSPIGGGSSRGTGGIPFPGRGRQAPGGPLGTSLPDGGWGNPLAAAGSKSQAARAGTDTVVRWTSALPVRHALQLAGTQHIEERPDLLEQYYIVSLPRVPMAMARLTDTPDKLRAAARLTPKDQPAIRAERVEVRPQAGSPGLDLYFPRNADLDVHDRQWTFELTAADYRIRAKFRPREMVYRGRLEL